MAGSGTADPCQSVTLQYDYAWSLGQPGASAPANRLVTRTWGNSNPLVCPAGQISEMLAWNAAGQVTAKRMRVNQNGTVRDLNAYWQYSHSLTTQEDYPNLWSGVAPWQASFTIGWGYDRMYRLDKMSWVGYGPGPGHPYLSMWIAENGAYNAAGQLTGLSFAGQTETRGYNNLGQLTSIAGGSGSNTVNLGYTYLAAQNDGRLEPSARPIC